MTTGQQCRDNGDGEECEEMEQIRSKSELGSIATQLTLLLLNLEYDLEYELDNDENDTRNNHRCL